MGMPLAALAMNEREVDSDRSALLRAERQVCSIEQGGWPRAVGGRRGAGNSAGGRWERKRDESGF